MPECAVAFRQKYMGYLKFFERRDCVTKKSVYGVDTPYTLFSSGQKRRKGYVYLFQVEQEFTTPADSDFIGFECLMGGIDSFASGEIVFTAMYGANDCL